MYTLKQYKIKIKDQRHSKLVQDELYRLGYDWKSNLFGQEYLFTNMPLIITKGSHIRFNSSLNHFEKQENLEVTLKELKKTESISELIINQLTGKEIVLMGEKKSLNIYFKGKLEIELKDFLIDLHIDCYQELEQISGEEEVGLQSGGYIDDSKTIEINKVLIIVYDKETCEPYTWINDKLTEQITEALINRIKFEN